MVGKVQVLDIICDIPKNIWKKTYKKSGISQTNFNKYFQKQNKAYAYVLGDVIKFDKGLLLSDIRINYYPQSFVYLKQEKK